MIAITWSCAACGVKRDVVQVRERRDDETAVFWLEEVVTPAIGARHLFLSASCETETLEEVMIPIGEGIPVGKNPVRVVH